MRHGGNVWQGDGPAQWLDYSANIRPEGAPDWVRAALLQGMANVGYYPDLEMRRARAALAEYLNLPDSCVLPTAGGISAIDMATHLETTGMVLVAPCFAEYAQQSKNRGKSVRSVSVIKIGHEIADPAECLAPALFPGCTVFLGNPLNPVGVAFSREQVAALLRLVERAQGFLVVDEAFIEYCPRHSAVSLIEAHERLLITGSMTKILGIPGVRLGYLCAQEQVLKELARYQLDWELNCFAEAVLCALPGHRTDIAREAAANERRRAQLCAGLRELGVFVYPSEAPFVLADFHRPVAGLIEKLKEQGILARSCLDFEGISDGRHLRLAVKDETANERLLKVLKSN